MLEKIRTFFEITKVPLQTISNLKRFILCLPQIA